MFINLFQVVQTQPGSLKEIWSTTMPPTDAVWVDSSSFVLTYPVRVAYVLRNIANLSKY